MANQIRIDIVAEDKGAQAQIQKIQQTISDFGVASEKSAEAQAILASKSKDLKGALGKLASTYGGTLDKELQQNLRTGVAVGNQQKYIMKNIRTLEGYIHHLSVAVDNGTVTQKQADLALQHYDDQLKQHQALLKQVTPQTTSFTQRMGNLIKSFVSAQLVVYALRTAVSGTINLLKEMSEVAGDAEETFNLFNVTFDKFGEQADETITQISNDIKMAKSTIADATGTVGDLLIGFGESQEKAIEMSDVVTRLVADLMSFKNINGDLTETISAFTSGLLGNTKNLRRFGVVVRDADVMARLAEKGLDGLTGEALELAKVYERLNIVIDQSPNAIGDMERTLDSTVNTTRRLSEASKEYKEILGKEINNIMTPIKSALADIIEGWVEAKEAKDAYFTDAPTIEEEMTKRYVEGVGLDVLKDALRGFDIAGLEAFMGGGAGASISTQADIATMQDLIAMASKYGFTLSTVLETAYEMGRVSDDNYKEWKVQFADMQRVIEAFDYRSFVERVTPSGQTYFEDMKDDFKALLGFDIENLVGVNPEQFADAVSVALGNVTETDAIEEQMDKLEDLYRLLDQFGADPNSTPRMRLFVEKWKEIVKQQYESAGLSLERIEAIEDESEEAEKLAEKIAESTTEYKSQLALLKMQKGIATKLADEDETIVALEQARAKALQDITDPALIQAIENLYDYQVEQQRELNALAEKEALAESIEAGNKAMTDYIDSLKESYALMKQNEKIAERFAQYGDERVTEEQRHAQALDELITTYQEALRANADYLTAHTAYLEGLRLENDLHDDNVDALNKQKELIDDMVTAEETLKSIRQASIEAFYKYGMTSNEQAHQSYMQNVDTIMGGGLSAEDQAKAIEGAWQEYLDKVDGFRAIVEGVKEGDWGKIGDGIQSLASQGTFGELGQIAVATDPATEALILFAQALMENEELMEELEPILNIVTELADYFAELLLPSIRAIVGILEEFDWLLQLFSFNLRLIASVVRTVVYPFELATDALKTIWLALKDLKGKITFWDASDDVTAEEWAERRKEHAELEAQYLSDLEDIWKNELDIYEDHNKDLEDALDKFTELYQAGQITGEQLSDIVGDLTGTDYDYTTPTSTRSMSRSVSNVSTNNMGDVTINVNGASSPQATAKEIASEIATLKRQGRL